MQKFTVIFNPGEICVSVDAGITVLEAMRLAGLRADAPCGGSGTCGKCRVEIGGEEVLACQTVIEGDMTVTVPQEEKTAILHGGIAVTAKPDGEHEFVLAFDVGTTTIVCYLLDGKTGAVLAQASVRNPQTAYGADVISRLEYANTKSSEELLTCVRAALADLTREAAAKAGIAPDAITLAAVVGNTAMHHLLFGYDPQPLLTPPYMPSQFEALELPAAGILPIAACGTVRAAANIAGFVGGDTVGCMAALRFDKLEELTLLIDIGTNGEMVLGDRSGRIACSTAAGPAFEGAKISMGMRGAPGAVDRVWLEDGAVRHHVIGEEKAVGLCGSGLLDLVAVLLDLGEITETGRMPCRKYTLPGTEVVLTQKDVREVQLAKGAIRAGIELMAERRGASAADIRAVKLAGAFGNYLDPASACRIGMIPPLLQERIEGIGNAAGEGAKLMALSKEEFAYASSLARDTEFLELASLPQFQDAFVDALQFEEDE